MSFVVTTNGSADSGAYEIHFLKMYTTGKLENLME